MVKKYCIQFIALFFICEVASAQYGILDTSFGIDGKVITAFGEDNSLMYSIKIQPDGKIVTGGTVNIANHILFALARYHPDGSLDTTFGVEGKSVIVVSEFNMSLSSIALQSDGKIVASGNLNNPNLSIWQPVLVRYNNNGTLDTTFGNQGMVTAFENENESVIKSITLQPDGKIIAVGYVTDNAATYSNFLLLRFNSNGNPDTDFGVNGIVNASFRVFDFASVVTLLSDGKIIVAGRSSDEWDDYYGYDYDFIIAKYNTNGTLETSFGNGGKMIVGADEGSENAFYVKNQPDGKIVIAGEYLGHPYAFMQVSLLSDGNMDADFGINGVVRTELPTSYLQALQTQLDGKIVAAGYYNPGACCSAIRLIRFMVNGDLDPTFGNNGIVSQIVDTGQAYSLALQPDGKILVSGGGGIGFGPVHTDFTMYRYTSGLNLSSFGSEALKNDFIVYPNPVKNILNMDFNIQQSEIWSVDLHDNNGRLILNLLKDCAFQAGQNLQRLDLPDALAEGVYFLKISNGKAIAYIKIIK